VYTPPPSLLLSLSDAWLGYSGDRHLAPPRIFDRFTVAAHNPWTVTGSLTRPLMRVDRLIGFCWRRPGSWLVENLPHGSQQLPDAEAPYSAPAASSSPASSPYFLSRI
jgi:hypothetical protein